MRGWLSVWLCLAWIPSAAYAQAEPPVQPLVTDRPDFTESAETVAAQQVQIEAGYTFTREEGADEHALGEVLVRIGLLDRIELRVGLSSYVWMDGHGADDAGLEDPSIGAKIELADSPAGSGARPAVAILAGITTPGADDFDEGVWQPEAKLALAWELGSMGLGSNVGYAWVQEADERIHQLSASAALGFDLAERLGGYVELFGFAPVDPGGRDALLANGGVTFLVHPDLQFDARIGAGLAGPAPDVFVGVGVAHRW